MGEFECQVCGDSFTVPQAALDKYPGWTPKYCRRHSPAKKKSSGSAGKTRRGTPSRETSGRGTPGRGSAGRGSAGGGSAGRGSAGGGSARGKGGSPSERHEENLTREQVLAKYTAGPDSGVFTDGSSHPNPGPGGWGMVWVEDGEIVREAHGHDPQTTNNRMELSALIAAYEALPEDAEVVIYSDSRLCVDTITKWAPGWERKGWKRKGNPLKNLDLVKPLLALHRAHPSCRLKWIEAHAGYRWNEYADSLANTWRRRKMR